MIDETRWLKLAVAVFVASVFGVLAPSTTTASAVTCSYDVPTTECVDVHECEGAETRVVQLNGSQERSAATSDDLIRRIEVPPAFWTGWL
jgi:hypothetical protein